MYLGSSEEYLYFSVQYYISKETLNKSLYTSCTHIFCRLAQKILAMRQHSCGFLSKPTKNLTALSVQMI